MAPGIKRKLQILEGLEGMNRFFNFWKLFRKCKNSKIQQKTDMKRNFFHAVIAALEKIQKRVNRGNRSGEGVQGLTSIR